QQRPVQERGRLSRSRQRAGEAARQVERGGAGKSRRPPVAVRQRQAGQRGDRRLSVERKDSGPVGGCRGLLSQHKTVPAEVDAAEQSFKEMERFTMKINLPAAFILFALTVPAAAQLVGGADRIQTRGPAPGDVPQAVFTVHRLGTDHAEGITTLDMTGNGRKDILSG